MKQTLRPYLVRYKVLKYKKYVEMRKKTEQGWFATDTEMYDFLITSFKFIYSEKTTKFCKTFDYNTYSQKLGEDFAKFCGLFRIYEV